MIKAIKKVVLPADKSQQSLKAAEIPDQRASSTTFFLFKTAMRQG